MASRSEATRQLQKLFDREVLDIHGVAELIQMQRSSVNTLIVRENSDFPEPIFELRGKKRHPLRLWWREDVERWNAQRMSSRDSSNTRGGAK
jgi:predicted DNA-binding transcriptional regulator AlpA